MSYDEDFRLIHHDPPRLEGRNQVPPCVLCGSNVNIRRYPTLDPPAIFADCLSCRVTWELPA